MCAPDEQATATGMERRTAVGIGPEGSPGAKPTPGLQQNATSNYALWQL